jgi:hypothetical protein
VEGAAVAWCRLNPDAPAVALDALVAACQEQGCLRLLVLRVESPEDRADTLALVADAAELHAHQRVQRHQQLR